VEEGYLVLLGEASDNSVLEEAGIRRTRGLVAAVDSDADNVFVGLSARKLNPKLHIVARASSDKLETAGADRTLSPYAVGGRRLASLATQPLVVDFLDIVTRGEKGSSSGSRSSACPRMRSSPTRPSASSASGRRPGP
jgi:voltage-gated potassium channel